MIVINILVGINTLLFLILSSIHTYWAFGGKWGSTAVIPTSTNDQPAFMPGKFITLIVALGLFSFAVVTLSNLGIFNLWIDSHYFRFVMWTITIIFYLRALGDFKQVGFSKKIKGTRFANNDTKFYSPLCLYLGTSSLIILLQ
jgi:hypothetical protein